MRSRNERRRAFGVIKTKEDAFRIMREARAVYRVADFPDGLGLENIQHGGVYMYFADDFAEEMRFQHPESHILNGSDRDVLSRLLYRRKWGTDAEAVADMQLEALIDETLHKSRRAP